MSSQPKTFLSPEEYLALERKAEYKSDYYQGEMFALAGATREHNLISSNVLRELSQQLRDRACEVYTSDMRIRIPATGMYTYPDVVVICGPPKFDDDYRDTLLNPTALVEVLSPSTESYDRGRKSSNYRTIESLKEYLLVSQDEYRVEQYSRQADGRWSLVDIRSREGIIELSSLQTVLKLSDVYAKVGLS